MGRLDAVDARRLARAGTLVLLTLAVVMTGRSTMAARDSDETCDGTDAEGARPAPDRRRTSYEVLPEVNLPGRVEDKIKVLADRFKKHTGKGLVITSGTRDASSQADVIFDKLEQGDDIVKLYKNKSASLELARRFAEGRAAHEDRASIVSGLTEMIRSQMKRGIFISAHLRAGAADVRSTDMTPAEKQEFVDAASAVGGINVMLESTPAHFHMQLAK